MYVVDCDVDGGSSYALGQWNWYWCFEQSFRASSIPQESEVENIERRKYWFSNRKSDTKTKVSQIHSPISSAASRVVRLGAKRRHHGSVGYDTFAHHNTIICCSSHRLTWIHLLLLDEIATRFRSPCEECVVGVGQWMRQQLTTIGDVTSVVLVFSLKIQTKNIRKIPRPYYNGILTLSLFQQ